jgi:hypothetical protein
MPVATAALAIEKSGMATGAPAAEPLTDQMFEEGVLSGLGRSAAVA